MREVFTMWKDVRMVALTVVIAAIYMAGLIPFKGLVIIPGFTEVRPANVFPVVFSLLFGPAAAWGAAIGNLLSDAFGGTLTWGSAFGFVGNFFIGFVGYKLWGNLGPLSSGEEPTMRSARQLVEYFAIALVAAAGTAAIIAWGLDFLGLFPFAVFATIITVNDFLAAAILGPPLLYLLYPRVKAIGALYPDLLDDGDLPDIAPSRQRFAAIGITVVSLAWAAIGIGIGVVFQDIPLGTVSAAATMGTGGSMVQIALGSVAFVLLCGLSALSGERLSALIYRDDSRVRSEPLEETLL